MSPGNTHSFNFTDDEVNSIYTAMRNTPNEGDPNYMSALTQIENVWNTLGVAVGSTLKRPNK